MTRQTAQEAAESEINVSVDTTGDGATALKALNDASYSLVMTDLRMPGLDGMDLIEEVQQRGCPSTVIVITGDGSIDEAVQAMHLGAYDFLTKPIDLEHLRLVVQRACASGRCTTN